MSNIMQRLARGSKDPVVIDFTRYDLLLPSPLTFSRADATACATRRRMNGAVGPTRTNYFARSNDFTSLWAQNQATVSAPSAGIGTWNGRNGSTLTENSAAAVQHELSSTGTAWAGAAGSGGQSWTAWFVVEANGRTAVNICFAAGDASSNNYFRGGAFDLTNGVCQKTSQIVVNAAPNVPVSSVQITALGSGKYLCAVTDIVPAGYTLNAIELKLRSAYNANNDDGYTGNGTSGIKIYHAQIEKNSSPTPPIDTLGTTAVSTTLWPRTNKIQSNVPRLGPNLATVTSADMVGANAFTAVVGNAAVVGRTYQVSYDYVLASGGGAAQFGFGGVAGPIDGNGTSGSRSFVVTATSTAQPSYFCNNAVGTIRNLKVQEQDLAGIGFTNATNGKALLTIADDGVAMNASGLRTLVPSGLVWKLDNSQGLDQASLVWAGPTNNLAAHTLSAWTRGSITSSLFTGTDAAWNQAPSAGATYSRIVGANRTPGSAATQLKLNVSAGDIVYVVLPQLEEGTSATPIIVNTSGAALTVQTPPFGDLQVPAADAPRLDFTKDGLPRGLRLEPACTNLMQNGRNFFGALSYNPGASTAANGYPAPDGSATASRITATAAATSFNFSGAGLATAIASGTAIVQQLWIKPLSLPGSFSIYAGDSKSVGGVTFSVTVASNLITAVSNGGFVENMGDGWQRLSMPYTSTAPIGANYTFGSVPAGFDALLWQAQVYTPSAGVGATAFMSDVITTGTSLTRSTETAKLANLADIGWNSTSWSGYVEFEVVNAAPANNFPTVMALWDGAGGNGVQMFMSLSGLYLNSVAGGSQTVAGAFIGTPNSSGGTNKLAFSLTGSQALLSLNGAAPVLITGGIAMTLFTQLFIGCNFGSPDSNCLRGWVRKVMGWGRVLTAAELQAAST